MAGVIITERMFFFFKKKGSVQQYSVPEKAIKESYNWAEGKWLSTHFSDTTKGSLIFQGIHSFICCRHQERKHLRCGCDSNYLGFIMPDRVTVARIDYAPKCVSILHIEWVCLKNKLQGGRKSTTHYCFKFKWFDM